MFAMQFAYLVYVAPVPSSFGTSRARLFLYEFLCEIDFVRSDGTARRQIIRTEKIVAKRRAHTVSCKSWYCRQIKLDKVPPRFTRAKNRGGLLGSNQKSLHRAPPAHRQFTEEKMQILKPLMLAAAAGTMALIAGMAMAQDAAPAAGAPAAAPAGNATTTTPAGAPAGRAGRGRGTFQRPPPYFAWAPKKTPYEEYKGVTKPIWRLADILKAHAKQANWTQPVVRNKDLMADWHQMASGGKTTEVMWPDNRVGMIVWSGQLRVSIQGQEPFIATKGFEINIPLRLPYTLETVGSDPALWLEVHQAGDVPLYPVTSSPDKPKDIPGYKYTKVVVGGGLGSYGPNEKPYLDYYKDVVNGGARGGAFIASDHFFMNNIRGMGTPMPPASDLGHFHVDMTEFWFIMEGKIDYQIEGLPKPFTAEAGDVVTAAMGRYHRASYSAGQMDTRVAINPFPRGLHDYPEDSGGRQ
jgi:mannose-6-phosphate isomerase-like protein (cupin superfamily)